VYIYSVFIDTIRLIKTKRSLHVLFVCMYVLTTIYKPNGCDFVVVNEHPELVLCSQFRFPFTKHDLTKKGMLERERESVHIYICLFASG
jgi:hypothetical protein